MDQSRQELRHSWCRDQIDAVVPPLGEIKLPVLIINGSEDILVPIEASHMANDRITSSDKTFEVYQYTIDSMSFCKMKATNASMH